MMFPFCYSIFIYLYTVGLPTRFPLLLTLSSVDERHPVNPRTDLICLCPNCHRMIHRAKDRIMTVEELKVLWQSRHSA